MNIHILDSAMWDLVEGFHFYERQQTHLGHYFLDSLYSDIDSLQLYAGIHQIKFKYYHCMFSGRFPFAIYYTITEDAVVIHAILDCRRNPESIKNRLRNEESRNWDS